MLSSEPNSGGTQLLNHVSPLKSSSFYAVLEWTVESRKWQVPLTPKFRLRKPTSPNYSFLMQNLFDQLSALGIKTKPVMLLPKSPCKSSQARHPYLLLIFLDITRMILALICLQLISTIGFRSRARHPYLLLISLDITRMILALICLELISSIGFRSRSFKILRKFHSHQLLDGHFVDEV
ncbi:hypothetical protein AMTRI_Chr03g54690 [Amborella trichopoda]